MFRSTRNGFQIKFPNGATISVQWNPGTYSDHYSCRAAHHDPLNDKSSTAEVWAWWDDNTQTPLWPNPEAYQTPTEVAYLMQQVSTATRTN